MFETNPYWFYDFGRLMQTVLEWASSTRSVDERAVTSLTQTREFLDVLIDPDSEFPMPQSADPAARLRDLAAVPLRDKVPEAVNKREILKAILKFNHVFDSELGTKDVLVVQEVGIYSSSALLTRAHRHLDAGVVVALNKLAPSATRDYGLAGRALAFDLNSACGFHALRAVEAVARAYHMVVKERDAVIENQPLSAVINEFRDHMKSSKGDRKMDQQLSLNVELLSKIDRIYRCPIMHPEMTLDGKKAKEVFDLSASVIASMVEDIKARYAARRVE